MKIGRKKQDHLQNAEKESENFYENYKEAETLAHKSC